jgi:hypothetical protein
MLADGRGDVGVGRGHAAGLRRARMPASPLALLVASAVLLGRPVSAWWSLHRLDPAVYPLARCLDASPYVPVPPVHARHRHF